MAQDICKVTDPNRHYGCRVNDQVNINGLRSMILQNEIIQVVIHVDKGTEITQFLHKPTDTDFIWHAKNKLHDPSKFVPAGGNDAAPFFDYWSGGWFEILPNNGPGTEYKGANLGFYAETINTPWDYQILEDTPEKVKVSFWVRTYRTPFLLRKTISIESGKPAIMIEEQVTNLGGEEMDFAWGHHPVVGPPFLDGSCRISCPECKVIVLDDEDGPGYRMKLHQEGRWPTVEGLDGKPVDLRIVLPKENKSMDNCYLTDYKDQAFIAVTNTGKEVGFGLAWEPKVFRYLWLWQAFGGGENYPWFSDAYQMGIEPWSSYPCGGLETAIKNKSALKIKPGDSIQTWMTAVAYSSKKDVAEINRDGKVEFNK